MLGAKMRSSSRINIWHMAGQYEEELITLKQIDVAGVSYSRNFPNSILTQGTGVREKRINNRIKTTI